MKINNNKIKMYKTERGSSKKKLSNVIEPIPQHENINMKFPEV